MGKLDRPPPLFSGIGTRMVILSHHVASGSYSIPWSKLGSDASPMTMIERSPVGRWKIVPPPKNHVVLKVRYLQHWASRAKWARSRKKILETITPSTMVKSFIPKMPGEFSAIHARLHSPLDVNPSFDEAIEVIEMILDEIASEAFLCTDDEDLRDYFNGMPGVVVGFGPLDRKRAGKTVDYVAAAEWFAMFGATRIFRINPLSAFTFFHEHIIGIPVETIEPL